MPVSSASAWSASVGSVIVSPSSSRRTVPATRGRPSRACPVRTPRSSSSILEVDRDDRPGVLRRVPRAKASMSAAAAGHLPGQGQLDRPLDRRLAGLVGAVDDRQPGRQRDLELAVAPEVVQRQPGDPHRRHLVAGQEQPAEAERRRGAPRPASSSSAPAAASSSAIRASTFADERAGDRVGRGQDARRSGPACDASRTRIWRKEPLTWPSTSSRSRSSSSGRTPVSRTSRTRSGSASAGSWATRCRLVGDRGRVEVEPSRTGSCRPVRGVDRDGPSAGRRLELDEEDLAGAVLARSRPAPGRRSRRTSCRRPRPAGTECQ